MSATAETLVAAVPSRGTSLKRRIRSLGTVGIASAVVIAIATLVAVFAPLLTPQDPNASNLAATYLGPSSSHLLGTNDTGQDILSRLIAGSRLSLLGPLAVAVLATSSSLLLAIIAAWRRGWADTVINGMNNLLFAFPGIILAILTATVFGASLTAAVLAITIAYVPSIVRVLRSAAVVERNQTYVAALEIQGFSATTICLRHLIPNMAPLIVAELTLQFGFAMVDLSALSFIGLGTQPPSADWGVMVANGQTGLLQGYPMESLSAGIAIFIVVLAFTLLGERLASGGGVDYRSRGSWLTLRSPRRRVEAIERAGGTPSR
ncbi:MAG TPA: ABC transporter permease [Solirubrobacteraceae bacterium]|nr:ABC transporter permease [Solirubrobacteraceae bacterium]